MTPHAWVYKIGEFRLTYAAAMWFGLEIAECTEARAKTSFAVRSRVALKYLCKAV